MPKMRLAQASRPCHFWEMKLAQNIALYVRSPILLLLVFAAVAVAPAGAEHSIRRLDTLSRAVTVPEDGRLPSGTILTGWALGLGGARLLLALDAVSDEEALAASEGRESGRVVEIELFGVEVPDALPGAALRARSLLDELVAEGRHQLHGDQAGGPVVCFAAGRREQGRPIAVCGSGNASRGVRDFGHALLLAGAAATGRDDFELDVGRAGEYRLAEAEARRKGRGLWADVSRGRGSLLAGS